MNDQVNSVRRAQPDSLQATARGRIRGLIVVATVFAAAALAFAGTAAADPSTVSIPTVQQVGADDTLPVLKANSADYTQHQTEVETDTFSWGSSVVSTYQVGRNYPTYGAQAIGWSTSTDSGQTWQHGLLPGLTSSSPSPNAAYPLVVNQSVGYSAKYGTWVAPSVPYLPAPNNTFKEAALLVNTSADGVTWNSPSVAVSTNVDKAWVSCDNTTTSPNYGNCYVVYSQIDSGELLAAVSSVDGGVTWSAPVSIPSSTGAAIAGYNTNVVVQPSGKVVVVATDLKNGVNGSKLMASQSSNAGATWSVPTPLATISYHTPAGGIRGLNKPTVDVDAAGVIYAAWGDCRFRTKCASNDIVFATTSNGTTWSTPRRVAIDATTTTVDRFIPGFAVAPGTSGATAQLSVVYYTYPTAACTSSTCRLSVQYATSYDGGVTWSAPYTINPTPMPLSWLTKGNKGPMVGDYESVSFCNGSAITVASIATAAPTPKTTKTPLTYHQNEFALTLPPNWG
ncbi:sialidase family protein [uncultured Jatrophihabitans sp.]|uniref:sialidase family protein n=1 Tax=uncultured Jatrophihabitans sp. TaxID=1610747 RepID=UPI0035CA70C4